MPAARFAFLSLMLLNAPEQDNEDERRHELRQLASLVVSECLAGETAQVGSVVAAAQTDHEKLQAVGIVLSALDAGRGEARGSVRRSLGRCARIARRGWHSSSQAFANRLRHDADAVLRYVQTEDLDALENLSIDSWEIDGIAGPYFCLRVGLPFTGYRDLKLLRLAVARGLAPKLKDDPSHRRLQRQTKRLYGHDSGIYDNKYVGRKSQVGWAASLSFYPDISLIRFCVVQPPTEGK